jgi:ankyrin repeat protein
MQSRFCPVILHRVSIQQQFIDPRGLYSWSGKPLPRKTSDPTILNELHRLCREGRLYDVERWIVAGKPLQLAADARQRDQRPSALAIALKAGNHDLVLLLLCNGYDANLERQNPLDLVFRTRRWDLLDRLLEGGADPRRVCLSDLLETSDSKLFERFQELGVDLTAGHELAEALGYHTSNKPLFGYARRHRQDPKIQKDLDIALAHHAAEGNARGVALCLWAGANPHAPVPSLRYPNLTSDEDDPDDGEEPFLGWSAIHEACGAGHVQILERLGLDPFLDDIEALYHSAHSAEVVEVLARFALPKNLGSIIQRQISLSSVASRYSGWLYTLRRLFELGARWEHSTRDEIADVRRYLLRLSDGSLPKR